MKKIFCLLLVVGTVLCICGCTNFYEKYAKDSSETVAETQTQAHKSTQKTTLMETEAPTQEETDDNTPVYYKDDKNINLYVTRYNECNPDYLINADELKKYYHHGREHDDQVKFTKDDFEITITGGTMGNNVKVYIEHLGKSSVSSDEYGDMFVRFAKPYNSKLTNKELQGDWQQLVDNSSNTIDFDDFECTKNPDPNIVYFTLNGKIE